ncbi:MAG TPA: cyclopropane fatty acyl phospholipid synthase [Candidatus Paceibacterota bacterium]|jgi:cyclopropane-fatty-acyl-phospholipid synthase|nr:cyclopropane fatty acyl phospholipid synthase [Candidatus Paceibacterota bacterium]
MSGATQLIETVLREADVRINGDRPWDIHVKDERFYAAVVRGRSLGFGEAYMAGWWDCERIDELTSKLFVSDIGGRFRLTPANVLLGVRAFFESGGTRRNAFKVGEHHYNIGNDLFSRMLDKRMVYTCGYWRNAKNLDEAQEAKLDLVCKKLGLRAGQKVLDIGCGWGSFAKFAAEKYGAHVTGVTVSKEQAALGKELCTGLPVVFELKDYRDVRGRFDHIVSLGMFEHVGYKHYRTYMQVVHDHLKDDGLFLLHTIGNNYSTNYTDPWIRKYIFPGGMLPSVVQVGKAVEKLFVIEDWQNFGADYDRTLMAWFANFDRHWPEIRSHYGDGFYRMWKFYLMVTAGSFRARDIQLWQVVLSKKGVSGGYLSVR